MGSKLPYKHLAALLVICVIGYFSVGQGERVPLLWRFDLGMHELGHLIGYILPIPEIAVAGAGSFLQIVVPLGLGIYFGIGYRNHVAAAFCVAWAAANFQDVSVYVADAPFERLPLIGGQHDWAFILGPENLDSLSQADNYASSLRLVGVALVAFALLLVLIDLWRDLRPSKYLQTLEARERKITVLDWG